MCISRNTSLTNLLCRVSCLTSLSAHFYSFTQDVSHRLSQIIKFIFAVTVHLYCIDCSVFELDLLLDVFYSAHLPKLVAYITHSALQSTDYLHTQTLHLYVVTFHHSL